MVSLLDNRATRLFLVRHGETVWNRDNRYQGNMDIGLSPDGYRQAELIAARLEKEKIDAVYSSNLSRAVETAAAIAKRHGLEPVIMDDLNEIHFGLFEGLTLQEIKERYPDILERWNKDKINDRVPGGESYGELSTRVKRAIDSIVASHPGGSVAVVSHGGALKSYICSMLGMDPNRSWQITLDNASLTIAEIRPKGAVFRTINDTGHLK